MKNALSFIFILCIMFGVTGCGVFAPQEDLELTEEEIAEANQSIPKAATGTSVSSKKVQTMLIYTVDSIQGQLVPLKVPLESSRITPELILDRVLENIDEKVEVTEIDVEKRQIFVTFNSKYAPLHKCPKKLETLILDCISNSLLDNIDYVDEVVFRSENGAYRSENYAFGIDEVYSSR